MFTKHMLEVCKGESTLLVNSLTGAMDEINTDELNKIKTGERNSTYDLLKRRGYLEEDQTQIKEKVIQYCQKCVSNFTNRLNLLLCLTYSCNLRCTYCFQQHSIHSKKEVMDVKQIEKAISDVETKILKKFNKDEYVISLFGGEPLQTKTYDVVEKVLILV